MTRERRKGNISRDRWLVSYADFITLLFAFFVVLYAFAKADQKKQAQVSAAIDTAFHSLGIFSDHSRRPSGGASSAAGFGPALFPGNIVMGENLVSADRVKNDLNHIRGDLEEKFAGQIASHSISIRMGRDGLVISLREAGFFDSGSATPKPETIPTLHQIAESLGSTPYDLRIEGHTDNIPIHTTEFDSNWELSSARATRIARLFLNMRTVEPGRLAAAGYAEFHPIATNDTVEGRAENRRVDLVILPRSSVDLSTSEAPRQDNLWHKITDNDPSEETPSPLPGH
ncbi:MAG: flagellar motor protein MotB [Terracidiphilus sp.]|jgi:chemotaxis protein MotB